MRCRAWCKIWVGSLTCDDTYFSPKGLTFSMGALRTKSDQCLGIISARTTGSAPDSSATYGVEVLWCVGLG